MKKIIVFLLVVVVGYVGYTYVTQQSQTEELKDNLLSDSNSPGITQDTQPSIDKDTSVTETSTQRESVMQENIQIIPLSTEQFLDFNTISETALTTGEVEISGTTNTRVDRIQVLFSNPTSNYPDDDYMLQSFETEEGIFTYRASSRNQVLDFGENQYIFRAISGESVSETKIVLIVPREDEISETGRETSILGEEENMVRINFPTSSRYGEPIKLGESSFTYSQIKGFEAKRENIPQIACEDVTEFLQNRISSWFYWNTCRDIVADQGIKINVLRLDGENYIYERHYLDFKHGIYATYELQRGSGVTPENIEEKNSELKQQDFSSLDVVDGLMRDILRSE